MVLAVVYQAGIGEGAENNLRLSASKFRDAKWINRDRAI
jgi:hypothetical protein